MTKVFPLRASEAERKRWQAAADAAGLSFNAWARRSLIAAAELEEALGRQGGQEGFGGGAPSDGAGVAAAAAVGPVGFEGEPR